MTTPRRLIQQVIRELDCRFGIEQVGDLSIKLLQADQLLAESERALNVDPAERWSSMSVVEVADSSNPRHLRRPAAERRGFRIHDGGKQRPHRGTVDQHGLGLVS